MVEYVTETSVSLYIHCVPEKSEKMCSVDDMDETLAVKSRHKEYQINNNNQRDKFPVTAPLMAWYLNQLEI